MPKISSNVQIPTSTQVPVEQEQNVQQNAQAQPPPLIRQPAMDIFAQDQFVQQRFTPAQAQEITATRHQTLETLKGLLEQRSQVGKERESGPQTKAHLSACDAKLTELNAQLMAAQTAARQAQDKYYQLLEQNGNG
jgi:hypothetical protein